MEEGKETTEQEQRVEVYIKDLIQSFVEWDILHFFYTNPQASDSLEGIAKNIGRDAEQMEQALKRLLEKKFLEGKTADKVQVYSLTEDKEKKKTLQAFMEFCQNPDNRLRLVVALLNRPSS